MKMKKLLVRKQIKKKLLVRKQIKKKQLRKKGKVITGREEGAASAWQN